jgi:hypothetical protein
MNVDRAVSFWAGETAVRDRASDQALSQADRSGVGVGPASVVLLTRSEAAGERRWVLRSWHDRASRCAYRDEHVHKFLSAITDRAPRQSKA